MKKYMVLTLNNELIGVVEVKNLKEFEEDVDYIRSSEFIKDHPYLERYLYSLVHFKPIMNEV